MTPNTVDLLLNCAEPAWLAVLPEYVCELDWIRVTWDKCRMAWRLLARAAPRLECASEQSRVFSIIHHVIAATDFKLLLILPGNLAHLRCDNSSRVELMVVVPVMVLKVLVVLVPAPATVLLLLTPGPTSRQNACIVHVFEPSGSPASHLVWKRICRPCCIL